MACGVGKKLFPFHRLPFGPIDGDFVLQKIFSSIRSHRNLCALQPWLLCFLGTFLSCGDLPAPLALNVVGFISIWLWKISDLVSWTIFLFLGHVISVTAGIELTLYQRNFNKYLTVIS